LTIDEIYVAEGNSDYFVSGRCQIASSRMKLIHCFGPPDSIVIVPECETVGEDCFSEVTELLTISFEISSRLTQIAEGAFSACAHLESICIPASVAILGKSCFAWCLSLSDFRFESNWTSRS
jgi:hypothetical protein